MQQKFLRSGVLCQALEMPRPYAPVYAEWATVFEQLTVDSETTIVGHSAGCGFILKWLSQCPEVKIGKLILVAPWLDPSKRRGDFLTGIIDSALEKRVGSIDLFYSHDEMVEGVTETKDLLIKTYPTTQLHLFDTKGHFCLEEMGTVEFPELWNVCEKT